MTTMVPTAAAGTSWSNPGNALANDHALAVYPANTAGQNWLRLTALTNRALPMGEEILGIRVTLAYETARDDPDGMGIPGPGYTGGHIHDRIEVALTQNGTTPWGEIKLVEIEHTGGWEAVQLGGFDDLWMATVTDVEIALSTFGILIRRADLADETTYTDRRVDFAYMDVYHVAPGGSLDEMERLTQLQQVHFGKETTPGTAVPATTRLHSTNVQFSIKPEFQAWDIQGDKLAGGSYEILEKAEGSADGKPDYNEVGWLLSSVLTKPVSQQLVAPSGSTPGVYRHTYSPNIRGVDDPNTFTFEYGDAVRAHSVKYALMRELELKFSRTQPAGLSGSLLGHRISDAITMTAGANCVQTLTLGSATSFRLRFKGERTAVLTTAGLNAAAIQSALQALGTVGSGNLLVSGAGPFTITAASGLAGIPLPLIEVVDATGGTTPTVAMTTPGGMTQQAIAPILPGQIKVYAASTLVGLDSGQLDRAYVGSWKISDRYQDLWVMDGTDDWKAHTEGMAKVETSLDLQANAAGMGFLANARANDRLYIRWIADGPTIAGGIAYQLMMTQAVMVGSISEFKDDQQTYGYTIGFNANFEPGWGQAVQVVLTNRQASY